MEYTNIHKSEGFGAPFSFGIKIDISAPITNSAHIRGVSRIAAEMIEQAVIREFYRTDKESQERAEFTKRELIECFPTEPIFVKEIPNGYCSRACCEHKKWLSVATKIGMVKIGWRKRVINIDWSETDVRRVISSDDVTKDNTMIHAWGTAKAKEYLAELLEANNEK